MPRHTQAGLLNAVVDPMLDRTDQVVDRVIDAIGLLANMGNFTTNVVGVAGKLVQGSEADNILKWMGIDTANSWRFVPTDNPFKDGGLKFGDFAGVGDAVQLFGLIKDIVSLKDAPVASEYWNKFDNDNGTIVCDNENVATKRDLRSRVIKKGIGMAYNVGSKVASAFTAGVDVGKTAKAGRSLGSSIAHGGFLGKLKDVAKDARGVHPQAEQIAKYIQTIINFKVCKAFSKSSDIVSACVPGLGTAIAGVITAVGTLAFLLKYTKMAEEAAKRLHWIAYWEVYDLEEAGKEYQKAQHGLNEKFVPAMKNLGNKIQHTAQSLKARVTKTTAPAPKAKVLLKDSHAIKAKNANTVIGRPMLATRVIEELWMEHTGITIQTRFGAKPINFIAEPAGWMAIKDKITLM